MYKIIIATHGSLAQSINDTLSLFVGEDKEIYSICLDDKGISEFEKRADKVIQEIRDNEARLMYFHLRLINLINYMKLLRELTCLEYWKQYLNKKICP